MTFTQTYSGKSYFLSDVDSRPHRLLVGVECQIGAMAATVYSLLDTAADWCVLPPGIAAALGDEISPVPLRVDLYTRLGVFSGGLARIPVRFVAAEGDSLTVEATWLICPDWPGPAVIGRKGCLERFRFAFQPAEESLYFAAP